MLKLYSRLLPSIGILLSLAGPVAAQAESDSDLIARTRDDMQAGTVLVRMQCDLEYSSDHSSFHSDMIKGKSKTRREFASGVVLTNNGWVLTAYHTLEHITRRETDAVDGMEYEEFCGSKNVNIEFFKVDDRRDAVLEGNGFPDIYKLRQDEFKEWDVLLLSADTGGYHFPQPLCVHRKLNLEEYEGLRVVGAGFPIDKTFVRFDVEAGTTTNIDGEGKAKRFLKMNLPSTYGYSGGPIISDDGNLVGIYTSAYFAGRNPAFNDYHFTPVTRFYDLLEDYRGVCPTEAPKRRLDVLFEQASLAILAGRYDDARALMYKAQDRLSPQTRDYGTVRLNLLRGNIEQQTGDLDDALRYYQNVLNPSSGAKPDDIVAALARLGLGDILLARGSPDQAKAQYETAREVLAGASLPVTGEGRLAYLQHLKNEKVSAIGQFELAADYPRRPWAPPESAQLALVVAQRDTSKADIQNAKSALQNLSAQISERDYPAFFGRVLITQAKLERRDNHNQKALETIRRAEELFDSIDDWTGVGLAELSKAKVFIEEEELSKAMKHLNNAIVHLDGRDAWLTADARERLSGVKIRLAEFDEAETLADLARLFFDDVGYAHASAQTRFRMGLIFFKRRDDTEASRLFREASRFFPDLHGIARSYWALGLLEASRGDVDAAGDYLRRYDKMAYQRDNRRFQAHFNQLRGSVAYLKSDYEEAKDWLTKSHRAFKNLKAPLKEAESRLMLAIVYVALGKHESATRHFEKSRIIFEQEMNAFGRARVLYVRAVCLNQDRKAALRELRNAHFLLDELDLDNWTENVAAVIEVVEQGHQPACNTSIVTNID